MENNQESLGGLVIPIEKASPGGADQGAGPAVGVASASAQEVGRRKTRSDIGKPRGPRGEKSTAGILPLSQTQFAQLYQPAIWQKALCAPADAMAAITGKKHWEVSEKEREAVGATGSIAAQCFAVSDPKWLALALCFITVLDVYGVRLAIDMAEKRRERAEKAKQNK